MSKFNTTKESTKVENLAGGQAYKQTPELELISILLTSFVNDQFYRSANDTMQRIKDLVAICNKKFVAQAAIYARTQFGMRSITHVVASELAKHIIGQTWGKEFYLNVIHRPDDMTEILAYHTAHNGKITNAMRKGLALAFCKFDTYQLAKYRGEGKGFKLIDVVNLVHPSPTEKNKEALAALVKGELKAFDTWEKELSTAGQNASNEEEKTEFKKDAWTKLIKEKKIGYFALLRNLRNIIEQAPDIIDDAIELLTNEAAIKRSLVLPFRYTTAYDEIMKMSGGTAVRKVMVALNKALDISVNNVPKFDGETAVVLDISGSMSGRPSQIGALFSAVLLKSNACDFVVFDDRAKYYNVNPNDSTLTIAGNLRFNGGGTNFHSIFETLNRKYDRIIILSDMQGWIGRDCPTSAFHLYKKKHGANPFVYSFDLNGYGSLQFPEQNVFAVAGFSDKIFDVMKLMEQDKQALVTKIKSIEL